MQRVLSHEYPVVGRFAAVCLLAISALVAALLVVPTANAQQGGQVPTGALQLSSDGTIWVDAPRDDTAILAWSEPFEGMSPGDSSEQTYLVRNNSSVAVAWETGLVVDSVDDYSYFDISSMLSEEVATVSDIQAEQGLVVRGDGVSGDFPSVADPAPTGTVVSSATIEPGATMRVTNRVTFPAAVGDLPGGAQQNYMNQQARFDFIPRVTLAGDAVEMTVDPSTTTPEVGEPVEFEVSLEPGDNHAGATVIVLDEDGNEVARVTIGEDGTATFTHTFDEEGPATLTVTLEPAAGQTPVDPVAVPVDVQPAEGTDPGPGPDPDPTPGDPGSGAGSNWDLRFPALGGLLLLAIPVAALIFVIGSFGQQILGSLGSLGSVAPIGPIGSVGGQGGAPAAGSSGSHTTVIVDQARSGSAGSVAAPSGNRQFAAEGGQQGLRMIGQLDSASLAYALGFSQPALGLGSPETGIPGFGSVGPADTQAATQAAPAAGGDDRSHWQKIGDFFRSLF